MILLQDARATVALIPTVRMPQYQRNQSQSTGPQLMDGWHSETFEHFKGHHTITFYNMHCEIKT